MRENYINGFTVTVGVGGIDNVSTTLPVTAAAPVDGGFRILVENEIMLVASGGLTTSWTVIRGIEGSTAALHLNTTTIYPILTAGSMDQIRQDMVGYGSALPSSPKAGDIFALSTNGVQYMYTGSIWQPYAYQYLNGNQADFIPSSPTAWDDEFLGSSINITQWTLYDPSSINTNVTQAMSNSWFTMNCTNTGVQQRIYGYMQAVPAGTWTFRSKFAIDCATWQYFGGGMFVRTATGDKCIQGMLVYFSGETGTYWFQRDTAGADVGDVNCYNNAASPSYMEVQYDGTNIYFRCSLSGAYYTTFYTEAQSTYLSTAPTHIGISMHPYGDGSSNPKQGMVISYDWFRRVA